jgi:hypothetical protein
MIRSRGADRTRQIRRVSGAIQTGPWMPAHSEWPSGVSAIRGSIRGRRSMRPRSGEAIDLYDRAGRRYVACAQHLGACATDHRRRDPAETIAQRAKPLHSVPSMAALRRRRCSQWPPYSGNCFRSMIRLFATRRQEANRLTKQSSSHGGNVLEGAPRRAKNVSGLGSHPGSGQPCARNVVTVALASAHGEQSGASCPHIRVYLIPPSRAPGLIRQETARVSPVTTVAPQPARQKKQSRTCRRTRPSPQR